MSIVARIRAHGGDVIRDRFTLRLRAGRLSPDALAWLRQPEIRAAVMREVWAEFDDWEERAAIMEFCGGMTRADAEQAAYRSVMQC